MIPNRIGTAAIARAYDSQSNAFDNYEKGNAILKRMRRIVHWHMESLTESGQSLLDLNAGTGIDALFFAKQGMFVYAIDISQAMLDKLRVKVSKTEFEGRITLEQRSFMQLADLPERSFDHIFSNFGGLNFTSDPGAVIRQFERLLKPGGVVTLVVMPPLSPWEVAAAFKGNFKMAFRRLKKGTDANVEGVHFPVFYYRPGKLIKEFGRSYDRIAILGLSSVAPPPNFDRFFSKHHALVRGLALVEDHVSRYPPFNSWADHYIISMRYKP